MSIDTVFLHGTTFLLHPELRGKDERYLRLRGGWWSFFYPDGERILWWGDMIRDDGGMGMYATADQHQRWANKYIGPSVIGPA